MEPIFVPAKPNKMIAFHTWYFRWTFEELLEFVGLVLPLKLQIVTDPRTSLKTIGDQKDDDDGYSKWVFPNGHVKIYLMLPTSLGIGLPDNKFLK